METVKIRKRLYIPVGDFSNLWRLSGAELRVYFLLQCYHKGGISRLRIVDMKEILGISPYLIKKAVDGLEKRGLISAVKRTGGYIYGLHRIYSHPRAGAVEISCSYLVKNFKDFTGISMKVLLYLLLRRAERSKEKNTCRIIAEYLGESYRTIAWTIRKLKEKFILWPERIKKFLVDPASHVPVRLGLLRLRCTADKLEKEPNRDYRDFLDYIVGHYHCLQFIYRDVPSSFIHMAWAFRDLGETIMKANIRWIGRGNNWKDGMWEYMRLKRLVNAIYTTG